jgi:hypothetical protein
MAPTNATSHLPLSAADERAARWTELTNEVRASIDAADGQTDSRSKAEAYLKAREALVQIWAKELAPRAKSLGIGTPLTLSNLSDGFPPVVANLMWRTFIGHAKAVSDMAPEQAAFDLPIRGGAKSCRFLRDAECATHFEALRTLLPGVIDGEGLAPKLFVHRDDWQMHDLIAAMADWQSGRRLLVLQVGAVEHEGDVTIVRIAGQDLPNRGGTHCHNFLTVNGGGYLQIQSRCDAFPPGPTTYSSTAIFRFDAPAVPLHGGDRLYVVADRSQVKASAGKHPTYTFSSPLIVAVYGPFPGAALRESWRFVYGVPTEASLDAADLVR